MLSIDASPVNFKNPICNRKLHHLITWKPINKRLEDTLENMCNKVVNESLPDIKEKSIAKGIS